MNIFQRVKNTANLTVCTLVINAIRSNKELSQYQLDWVHNLFNITDCATNDDQARLAFLLFENDASNAEVLSFLSQKIADNQTIDCDDWTFILYGLKFFQKYLLNQNSWMNNHLSYF